MFPEERTFVTSNEKEMVKERRTERKPITMIMVMLHKWIVVEVGLDAPRHDHHHRHDQHLDEF